MDEVWLLQYDPHLGVLSTTTTTTTTTPSTTTTPRSSYQLMRTELLLLTWTWRLLNWDSFATSSLFLFSSLLTLAYIELLWYLIPLLPLLLAAYFYIHRIYLQTIPHPDHHEAEAEAKKILEDAAIAIEGLLNDFEQVRASVYAFLELLDWSRPLITVKMVKIFALVLLSWWSLFFFCLISIRLALLAFLALAIAWKSPLLVFVRVWLSQSWGLNLSLNRSEFTVTRAKTMPASMNASMNASLDASLDASLGKRDIPKSLLSFKASSADSLTFFLEEHERFWLLVGWKKQFVPGDPYAW